MTPDHYSISAQTAPEGSQARFLKDDDLFCVLDNSGNIARRGGAGLFYRDTRFISGYELRVNGMRPSLLASSTSEDNTTLNVRLACRTSQSSDPQNDLHIERSVYVLSTTLYERLSFHNSSRKEIEVLVEFEVDADFADIFEVRGQLQRAKRGELSGYCDDHGISFHYVGLDTVERDARIDFDPQPRAISLDSTEQRLTILPGQSNTVYVSVKCQIGDEPADVSTFSVGLKKLREKTRDKRAEVTSTHTSNDCFNKWLARSLADLYTLTTETTHGAYPFAGIPWFSAPFGRDGIIVALQTLWMDPLIARAVLGFLAGKQAKDFSPACDAEPGKILHEARAGEMANTGEVPFKKYYGSVDATPLFIILAGEYFGRTGDHEFIATIWPNIVDALRWIDKFGDLDGDGLVEYQPKTDIGLVNQGWKDSVDSIFHSDGSPARGPIALCEVQGYVFAAKRHAAALARIFERGAMAAQLEEQADELRPNVEDKFWSEKLGTYVLALDGDKRQCAVRTSNAGHLLFTGLAGEERAEKVAEMLCGPSFFSGWGIRTVADSEARFNPLSYHNGSIWPHDVSLIALGLANYGFADRIDPIFQGLLDASAFFDSRRVPELFSGSSRKAGEGPVPYPHACAPQAWSAGAPFAMLKAMLGIGFDVASKEITLQQPRLPSFLESVQLRSLRLGNASVVLTLTRSGDDVQVAIDNKRGDVGVVILDSAGESR